MSNLSSTEKALILNPIVLDPVLEDPAVRKIIGKSDPAEAQVALRNGISISSAGARTRLNVSFTDVNKDNAALVCNAIVDSYLQQRDAFDSTRVNNLERWIEPEIVRWETEVEGKQRVVQQLSERMVGFAPNQRIDAMENRSSFSLLQSLRSQIADLQVEMTLFDANRAMNDAKREELTGPASNKFVAPEIKVERIAPTEDQIEDFVNASNDVKNAYAMVRRYEDKQLELRERDMIRIRQDYFNQLGEWIEEWSEKAEIAKKEARERAIVVLEEKADEDFERRKLEAKQRAIQMEEEFYAEQERKKAQWVTDLDGAREDEQRQRDEMLTRLNTLEKEYDEEKENLERFGGATAEMQFAQEELAIANGILTKLRGRVAAIRTERAQEGSVRSLAKATPPNRPIEQLPMKKLMMASAGAFFIPFALGLLWEFRVQRFTDSASIERVGDIAPIMGEVARLPSGTGATKGRRLFEESVDTLRANLFLSADTRHTRSIAVASSMSGEGKSSVSSQLALSIAKASGKTVLLVDADVRCPDQHEIFGLEMGQGLCGVLSKEAKLSDVANSSLGDLIHIVPAGRLNCSPHRLITPDSMKEFIDEALESYSYVVIDTAPVLSAGEALAVASAVDSTLLCVMRDVSRVDSVTRTTRRLEAVGASIAGTVFSGVAPRQYAYRYGNYHYAMTGDLPSLPNE
ncbi:MAG: polysaccharide biosynthesis tyrosine autokinase [Planctomycetota bacterium]